VRWALEVGLIYFGPNDRESSGIIFRLRVLSMQSAFSVSDTCFGSTRIKQRCSVANSIPSRGVVYRSEVHRLKL